MAGDAAFVVVAVCGFGVSFDRRERLRGSLPMSRSGSAACDSAYHSLHGFPAEVSILRWKLSAGKRGVNADLGGGLGTRFNS